MTTALPAPEPCPSFLPVVVKDLLWSKGTLTPFFLDCGSREGHDGLHHSANGREWTDAQGIMKRWARR